MPDPEDSLGGETFSGEEQQDPAEQSLGDQATFGDANVDDELFDDGMEVVDLTTRYTEEGVLGKGGMGEVILATDTRLGRKVAIKRIIGKAARSKTAVARFLTEAKSMAELNHPNIVQIHDYGRSIDGPFLIMECVQGGSLLEKCKEGPIELDEAVDIFGQLCDGLAKAHAAGIIHRDIKPANVLMTEDGVPKLTDFGLAKDDTADTGMTMEGAVIGTLDFMPPEQRQAAELTDHRSDLWSLAATFYQMLTGKSPKIIKFSNVPTQLQDALGKALEDEKEDRFQSVHEMRETILQAHSGKMDTFRTLAEGECPQCATPNPSHGKFCNECSAILQVQCLKCKVEIQIWNKACGDCGAQQAPLEDSLRQTLNGLKDSAQKLSEEMNFPDAKDAANEILAQQHPRLLDHHDWARSFIDITQAEEQRLTEFANGRYEEAKQHRKSFDYDAAIQAMKSIHPSFATEAMAQWNHTLIEDKTQGEELYAEIKTLLTSEKYAGLLSKVDRLIKIRGPKDSLTTLKDKLTERELSIEKHAVELRQRAQRLYSVGDLDAATHLLNRIPIEIRNDEDSQLVQQLAIASPILQQIREFVSQSKADFDNFTSSVPRLLALVMQYLEIVPEHDQIDQLKNDLIKRIDKNYQKFYTADTDVQFSDIPIDIRLLIPPELLNTYIRDREDVKVFSREARQQGIMNIPCSVCNQPLNIANYVKHFDGSHSSSSDAPPKQANPQEAPQLGDFSRPHKNDLLAPPQDQIAEEAHESAEATLIFTITNDKIENQYLTGQLTVTNRSPYNIYDLFPQIAVLNDKRTVARIFESVTHLPPGQSHTWDNIGPITIDSDAYDRFDFENGIMFEIKDTNDRELPQDSVQMKIQSSRSVGPSQQDNPQKKLVAAQQQQIAEAARDSGTATLEFTITNDKIEDQYLTGQLTVMNRSPYDIYDLFPQIVVLNDNRTVAKIFESVTHLPPGQIHTWNNIGPITIDSDAYDRFDFEDEQMFEIKDTNGRELPQDSVQMKMLSNKP